MSEKVDAEDIQKPEEIIQEVLEDYTPASRRNILYTVAMRNLTMVEARKLAAQLTKATK